MNVITDQDVLDGKEIQYAERDKAGVFHFFSKAVLNWNEICPCQWDQIVSIHPKVSDLRSLANGKEAEKTSTGDWRECPSDRL